MYLAIMIGRLINSYNKQTENKSSFAIIKKEICFNWKRLVANKFYFSPNIQVWCSSVYAFQIKTYLMYLFFFYFSLFHILNAYACVCVDTSRKFIALSIHLQILRLHCNQETNITIVETNNISKPLTCFNLCWKGKAEYQINHSFPLSTQHLTH